MSYFDEVSVVKNRRLGHDRDAENAHWLVECAVCSSGTLLAIAIGAVPAGYERELAGAESAWLMCTTCGMGAFAIGSAFEPKFVFPRPFPFPVPDHLETSVSETWLEALRSFSAQAYTGCTLMCRKIIFHMAVETGLPAKNERGSAPNFDQCLSQLVTEGYITPRQKDEWAGSIRLWGNAATHELAAIEKDIAYSALEFTYELLRMVYTFSAAARAAQKTADS